MLADETISPGKTCAEDSLLGAHSQIAEKLRAFYTVIQKEQIPDHLLMLLEKLDEAEKNGTRIKADKAAAAHAEPDND